MKAIVESGLFGRHARAVGVDYDQWREAYDSLSNDDVAKMRRLSASLLKRPLISVVMPVYNTPEGYLREAIESVRAQTYDRWELCIADDCSTDSRVQRMLDAYVRADARIKVTYRPEHGHIARASNSALELAIGQWVVLVDHDDTIAPHALFCVADVINRHPHAKLIYSDEDKIGFDGRRRDPYFKSNWNRDLFLSHNLFSHLGAYLRELIVNVGGFRAGFEGAQDYDLVLRCLEEISDDQIWHIPHVLYHWRMTSGSASLGASEKPYAMPAGERAINEHLQRTGTAARAQFVGCGYRVQYQLPNSRPLVSVIIPTRNRHELVRQCLASVERLTTYSPYEIILVGDGSGDRAVGTYLGNICPACEVRTIRYDKPFNLSAMINLAVAEARGSILALLSNDFQVRSPDWLSEMVSIAVLPGVGVVGARLWYSNDRLQHGGLILSPVDVAINAHSGIGRRDCGYFGRAALQQSISAVSAACLVVRKDLYFMVGGLNERDLPVAYNDVDFCLKLCERGFRNVWTPYAELYRHESSLRAGENSRRRARRFRIECDYMRERWQHWLCDDPAYSPNLSIERGDFSLAFPPRRQLPWRASHDCEPLEPVIARMPAERNTEAERRAPTRNPMIDLN